MENPQVYWLTGLSGAGKTTIGNELYLRLKEENPAVLLLDGDALRTVFSDSFGYSTEERRKCAMCYSRLCKLVSEQGITVVCCTISMFDSVREWNRKNIHGYVEIYIKASPQVLLERDQKRLYSGLQNGTASQVIGMDIQMEEPKTPDIVLENDGRLSVKECVNIIMNRSAAK